VSPTRVRCPTCDREIQWSDGYPFRPFCSERCKLIDLGAWLSEARGIPGDARADLPEQSADGAEDV
jgi:endogenous inhibitor of DNA gyrase (YacG/DUF329 family)